MLAIFNPEHDLCLANGSAHYVPPQSALDFARRSATLMQIVYPAASCCCAAEAADGMREGPVVPWGWNAALKAALLRQGFAESLLPSDETLARWRGLQHRATLLPLQPDCSAVTTDEGVGEMLAQYGAVVMKAPWSGSGRGLRWVTGEMSGHDRLWLRKIVREQRCVVVEPRRKVAETFALEYRVEEGALCFAGYSLFQSASGVYRGNLLLPDEEIARRVCFAEAERRPLEWWLSEHIAPYYEGPLGVDFILDAEGTHCITELNLRHTMGLLAHEYLRRHPAAAGAAFSPSAWLGR